MSLPASSASVRSHTPSTGVKLMVALSAILKLPRRPEAMVTSERVIWPSRLGTHAPLVPPEVSAVWVRWWNPRCRRR